MSAANGIDVSGYTQLMGDFHQVVLGDAIALGNLLDCREPIVLKRQIHQHTQRVVGVDGQAHTISSAGSYKKVFWILLLIRPVLRCM